MGNDYFKDSELLWVLIPCNLYLYLYCILYSGNSFSFRYYYIIKKCLHTCCNCFTTSCMPFLSVLPCVSWYWCDALTEFYREILRTKPIAQRAGCWAGGWGLGSIGRGLWAMGTRYATNKNMHFNTFMAVSIDSHYWGSASVIREAWELLCSRKYIHIHIM
jgi:hypothetical protein